MVLFRVSCARGWVAAVVVYYQNRFSHVCIQAIGDIQLTRMWSQDGGLTTLEAQLLLRGLRGLHLVGGDFVCTSPPFDPTGNTQRVAANMMFEMLCLLAEARSQRKGETSQVLQ